MILLLLLYGIIALNSGPGQLLLCIQNSERSPARFPGLPALGSCLRSAGNECVSCDAVLSESGGHLGWGAAAPRPLPYIFAMLDEFRRTVPTPGALIVLRSFALNIKSQLSLLI